MDIICKSVEKCLNQSYSSKLQTMICNWNYYTNCQYSVEHNKYTNWRTELLKINQCPQRQDSITDQMIDLYYIANKFGFYDAADHIRRNFIENNSN